MEAPFTVDAYPGETFVGKISQVRLAATTVQNVVTYSAIVDVRNPDFKLKPGMTANVKILIDKVSGTLKVPNAALRFRPSFAGPESQKNGPAKVTAEPPNNGVTAPGAARQTAVWTVSADGTSLRPVFVQLGMTDGVSTQLLAGNLKQGDRIVTGVESDSQKAGSTSTRTSKTAGFGGPMGGPMGPPPQ